MRPWRPPPGRTATCGPEISCKRIPALVTISLRVRASRCLAGSKPLGGVAQLVVMDGTARIVLTIRRVGLSLKEDLMSRMQRPTALAMSIVAATFLATAPAQGQQGGVEIGTEAGISILRAGGANVTIFGIPGASIQGGSAIYATIFTSSNVAIEPQLNFTAIRAGGETLTSLGFAGRVKYFFKGPSVNSAYVVGDGALARLSGLGESETDFALGGGIGFRSVINDALGFHIEGRYRRWFEDFTDVNEFTVAVGLGAIVGGGNPVRSAVGGGHRVGSPDLVTVLVGQPRVPRPAIASPHRIGFDSAKPSAKPLPVGCAGPVLG